MSTLWSSYLTQVESHDGSKYCLVITVNFTRYCMIFLSIEKSNVLDCFKIYAKRCERLYDSKLIRIGTDNGKEFANKYFKKYFEENGIQQSFTVTYLHFQNETVKRLNHTSKLRIDNN